MISAQQVLALCAALWRQAGREAASELLSLEADDQLAQTKNAVAALRQSAAIYLYLFAQHMESDVVGIADRCSIVSCTWT